MKLPGTIVWVLIAFMLATAAHGFGQNGDAGPDLLEKRTEQLAGPGAVNCGRVPARGEPKAATDCALAADQAGKPFRVRYDLQGIDSFVSVAFVRLPYATPKGHVTCFPPRPPGPGRDGSFV